MKTTRQRCQRPAEPPSCLVREYGTYPGWTYCETHDEILEPGRACPFWPRDAVVVAGVLRTDPGAGR